MASTTKFSYQRLVHEGAFEDEDDYELRERIIGRAKSWSRARKVHIRKRLKVRIPSLGKFLRRKARLVVVSWAKVLKRLKDSRSHFGDLFAGNYLFVQVTPTSFKYVDKSFKGTTTHHDLSSRYSLPKIA
ncbi:uncharacterized protein LOC132267404 [Cornus florida]|uniref:uncharacterized protein LOC132267404 n=1 Tax=Cornus florida TaxID=4283 RepID=UPI0028988EED|nr:uncharacterized protein LOC132267404 [Cornus florida]